MVVKGANEIIIDDVLVGDVWVCSGQSNMASKMGASLPDGAKGKIREFSKGRWGAPRTFSIIGWKVARAVWEQEKVPVELFSAALNATSIEQWMPDGDLEPAKPDADPKPESHYKRLLASVQPLR
ncbi:MAG: hypothetical protein ACUVWX_14610 [Kiritimatiellia bacterium]